jgi:hypothetical protein
MKTKSSTTWLKKEIQLLKEEHALKGKSLIKQFHLTYESLKPVNLLKSTINDVSTSPYLMDNIIGTSVGIATGYLSKKIIVAGSDSKFRKLLGSILQFGVTNLVAKNPEAIKSFGQFIFHHISSLKKHQTILPEVENEL